MTDKKKEEDMKNEKKVVKKNPSTKETETTKRDKIDLDPNCEFCLKKMPISPARVERIKEALSVWFDTNPEVKSISEFYYPLGISMKTYYRLLERDPELKELHEITMHRLGDKLWGRSVDCRANWYAVKFKLHQYSPEYKEAREFEAQLAKKDETVNNAPQIVVLERFPSDDRVPNRKMNDGD
jgi:hypothetical protein